MIPMSNTSSYERFRQDQAQRRSVARSNSSLLGSLKNFVAAPFARLFTGTTDGFDDPNDLSGKRRLAINQNIDNNDIVEDGPAPAKRMRVKSPERPSPQRSTGYLDPPGSAFHLDNRNNLFNQPPSRSVSISLPSTTLPDSSVHNARSTISPLRNTFSRNMSIDSIPTNQPRPLSRDISMKSLSSIPVEHSLTMRAGSRDSMPPLSSHSFRLRDSATPQPHHSFGRKPNRDVSEPPPVTMLHSNPVFVRGPSLALEPQSQPVPTLGSLVDAQRIVQSPSRQRSLLFGSSQHAINSQAIAAERTLHELEFYKTPLVPTRIRSRMPSSLGASASSTNLTDMFARKHSLILMGDHDRPTKRDKKNKGQGKSRSKEINDTKPYAGTTGIKKRLAKAKAPSQDEKTNATSDHASVIEEPKKVIVPELPVPPPKEKDTFNVAAFPPTTSPAQRSSLRVGRAARSHLSRPIKKFSASFDDEDDQVSDDARKDLEMLTEAAKKVPIFEIPASFSFAKEVPSVEPTATAKEPPLSALPFSLTSSAATLTPLAQSSFNSASEINLGSSTYPSSQLGTSLSSAHPPQSNPDVSSYVGTGNAAVKVPNFFAASKALASQPPIFPPSAPVPTASGLSSPFSFTPSPDTVVKEPAPTSSTEDKKEQEARSSLSGAPPISTTSTFAGQSIPPPTFASIPTSVTDRSKKDESQSSLFSFGSAPTPSSPPTSQPPSFSFGKSTENSQSSLGFASSVPFSSGNSASATPVPASKSTLKDTPFSFGTTPSDLTSSTSLFGSSSSGDSKSPGAFSFGVSNEKTKHTSSSPFGASNEISKPASSSLFGLSNASAKPTSSSAYGQPSSESSVNSSTKFSFGSQPGTTELDKAISGAGNNTLGSSPFSFAAPPSGTPEPSKALFGSASGAGDSNKSSGFLFGGSSSAPSTSAGVSSASSPFTFGSGVSSMNNTSSSPFTFGAAPPRPVTPPNQDHEVRMDESPTRDIQVNKASEPRPSLSGFPFSSAPSTSTTSSLFGQNSAAPVSSGFPFGQSSGASNPFSSSKPAENKAFGISSNREGGSTPSPFSFGRTPENEPPRPSTTGSFSFGTSAPLSTGPGPTFSFGAPSNNSVPSNPFGVAQTGSTPNSPSTFGPSSSFSFGATPGTGNGNAFPFGSQPASPATPNMGLPSAGFGATTSNPFGGPPASSPGFGAPSTTAPSSGGSLFTIGAAPPDSNRQIKKLPTRKKR